MAKKKRQILSAVLVVALCSVVALNWFLTESQQGSSDSSLSYEYVTGNLGDSLFVAGTTAASSAQDISSASLNTITTKSSSDYFLNAKLKRQNTYDTIIDSIEELLDEEGMSQEMKGTIKTMISDFKRDMKTQTDAENIISAKTGSECLVVINSGKCEVILQKNTLNDSLVLQISEIIQKNTNISAENLTIIESK